jgi:hypothetical protein
LYVCHSPVSLAPFSLLAWAWSVDVNSQSAHFAEVGHDRGAEPRVTVATFAVRWWSDVDVGPAGAAGARTVVTDIKAAQQVQVSSRRVRVGGRRVSLRRAHAPVSHPTPAIRLFCRVSARQ